MTLLSRPTVRNQRRLTRLMQAVLLGIVAYGLVYGQPKAITNGAIALVITFLPALLERNYDLPLDPWLGLWITLAVFLHTMGSAGLYARIGWWDHLTHAMSASLVAGAGYTVARAIDLHSDDIRIPRRFAFVYVLIVVLSFGVVWELFEFGLDVLADATGITMPLAQHGLDDTVRDLPFNSLGAIVVATFGQAHLLGVAPMKSMIDYVFETGRDEHRGAKRDVWSFLGAAWEDDLPYHRAFTELDAEHENCHYVPCLSRESWLTDWTGETEYIQDALLTYVDERALDDAAFGLHMATMLASSPTTAVDARIDPHEWRCTPAGSTPWCTASKPRSSVWASPNDASTVKDTDDVLLVRYARFTAPDECKPSPEPSTVHVTSSPTERRFSSRRDPGV